ncbi:MAG: V-type ATP synthase subunit D [Verrucomicrobia bacterium]|nr:V-type ATP synthase subunit D [Verrucomicrobiota bacterium]
MATIALSKANLTDQVRQLRACRNFLPSLDLKRQQLLLEQRKARLQLAEVEQQRNALKPTIEKQLPMLGDEIDLNGLVKLKDVQFVEENVMGIMLPKVDRIAVQIAEYSFLAKPPWVDQVVQLLKEAIEVTIRRQVIERRVELLAKAARTVSQRVNLFEKVLIPRIQDNIKRIRLAMADSERASIVSAKIAKGKKAAA